MLQATSCKLQPTSFGVVLGHSALLMNGVAVAFGAEELQAASFGVVLRILRFVAWGC
jgi:hypothetical protein